MMPLGYSEINENIKPDHSKKKNKRKTIKKRDSNNRVKKFLNSMNSKESFQGIDSKKSSNISSTRKSMKAYDSDEDEFGEPYENKTMNEDSNENKDEIKHNTGSVMEWDKDKLESFGLLKEGLSQQERYQKEQSKFLNQYIPTHTGVSQNVPYYSQLANSQSISGSRDELMRKLNHIVYMLEEQQDEKTGSVTEELVLYMFLGVFVIFVVDSFSRVSKYTR